MARQDLHVWISPLPPLNIHWLRRRLPLLFYFVLNGRKILAKAHGSGSRCSLVYAPDSLDALRSRGPAASSLMDQ